MTPTVPIAAGGPPPRAAEGPLAALPALLLPVRIETLFAGSPEQPQLWVRVYPDQIAIDTHDPRFTAAEEDGARRYWDALWRAGTADAATERRAWQSLAQRFGPTRAAYVAHAEALQPSNLAARPATATPAEASPSPAPDYPDLDAAQRRDESWSRAPQAAGLPERWTVVLERGGAVVRTATGAEIAGDLAFGPDPNEAPSPTPDGVAIDEPMRWMVDFDEAVRVGMGLRIDITREDHTAGFDRLLVHGLGPAEAARPGPETVRALFDAHRFTDGFALVPQGAATNNTADGPSAVGRADPGFDRSFALEVQPRPAPDDGQIMADALGLPSGALARAEYADRGDQGNARAMATAVWPATGGYFLEQMMPEVVDRAGRERARAYVLDRVRARGPLPALRVGDTPYGLLPATAVSRLRTKRLGAAALQVADFVRRAWPQWRASAERAPHVSRDGDPDAELVAVLGMDASARSYRARHVLGPEFLRHSRALLGIGGDRDDRLPDSARAALARLGHADWDPRFAHLALMAVDRRVTDPIVDGAPVSEDRGLPPVELPGGGTGNYISWLRDAPLASLRSDASSFPGGVAPRALLYKVLRQALLAEYAHGAKAILVDAGLADAAILQEHELVGFERVAPVQARPAGRSAAVAAKLPQPSAWEALMHPMPGARDRSIGDQLYASARKWQADTGHLGELLRALDRLAGQPTAELERLFTETLDLFSHRLDAWVTSLATEIDSARAADKPRDFLVGGYGWVEDLRPKPAPEPVRGREAEAVRMIDASRVERTPEAPRPRPARAPREDAAGFVHAPSLAQARAGAVLRSGYLTHRETSNGRMLALDLSSARVRTALDFLDGIRNGQPLGALLGYRFERGLNTARLQVLVQPFRDRFPVVANRVTEPAGATEAVAASGVVDGRALHDAWRDGSLWSGPPALDGTQRRVVERLLADLDDVLDAIGDLSIAESVHQVMRGNPVRAGGLIDAISRGERPPDPDVVRTPRAGIDVTHRVAILLTPGPARAPGWPGASGPRAVAEPRLDAWVSTQLAHPERVRCAVSYDDAGTRLELTVTLADLEVGPLDALELALADDQPQASELEQRILYVAERAAPAGSTGFEIAFERRAPWPDEARSFPEFLAAARDVRELIGASRALTPQDLIDPEREAVSNGAVLDTAELDARVGDVLAALHAAIDDLAAATSAHDLRDAIVAGGLFGAAGGVPQTPVGGDPDATAALRDQAGRLAAALDRRRREAQDADAAFDRSHAAPEALAGHLIGMVETVLGGGFTVCPRFTPGAGAELEGAFGATAAILDDSRDAPARWLTQLGRVRTRVGAFTRRREAAWLFAGLRPPEARLAQLPARTPDRWLGLDFDPASPPASGRVSILAEVLPSHSAAEPHAGLLVDEWVERIPVPEQTTGVAFHYDQPSARAPQCVLLAVCPDDRERWDADTVRAILDDTLDLAKVRAVDLESMTGMGQLLPALLFPFNTGEDTISVNFVDVRAQWLR